MSNEIILKNNVGYGEVYLNNLIKNIDDVISKCVKIKSQYDQVQTYSIKTRFGNIYCNERSSEYSVYVTYEEGGKQLSRNAYINTSKTNKEIEKARNQINKLITKLTELKEAMIYNKSTMKIAIENFRKEDALRAKQIEDIKADPKSNIRVGKDENGNYIFVRTRMVSTTQLESIINEKFKDNIENRKYKIDNLNKADGYAIVFDNGDVYSMDENGNLFKDEGSILKSHSINYSGGKVGSIEMAKVKGAY